MTIWELLFILGVLLTLVLLSAAGAWALTGHRRRALRTAARLGAAWATYLAVVLVVAARTPQRVYAAGAPQCFDDMCFAVTGAAVRGNRIRVTVRVSNHARRVTEGEAGLRAKLWDQGVLHAAAPGAAVPLGVRLPPGASIDSEQTFDFPGESEDLGLVLNHGFTPGWFVIGESPLLRLPAVMRLESRFPTPR